MPQYRATPEPKNKLELVGRELGRRVWGTFGVALDLSTLDEAIAMFICFLRNFSLNFPSYVT